MVSVIVPVYNVEDYIDACLESIVNQTYKDIEVILINDGSTDFSGKKCIGWCERDSRIRCINQANGGLGPARNRGMEQSHGEFLVFIDSDDWVDPDYIQQLYDCISKNDADMCICDYYIYDNEDKSVSPHISETRWDCLQKNEKDLLLSGTNWSMWIKMYRRSLFTRYGIKIPNVIYEDLAVYPALLFAADKVCFIEKPLYYYRSKRVGSIMNTSSEIACMMTAVQECTRILKEKGFFEEHYEEIKKYVLYQCGRVLSPNKDNYLESLFNDFLDREYKDWQTTADHRVFLLGSFNTRWILQRWIVDFRRIRNHQCFSSLISLMSVQSGFMIGENSDNSFRLQQMKDDLSKNIQCLKADSLESEDYLFIDFLEERFDLFEVEKYSYITYSDALKDQGISAYYKWKVIESGSEEFIELWKQSCLLFIEKIQKKWKPDRVILVKMRLSERYGNYFGEEYFQNIGWIRKINSMLEQFENYFAEHLNGVKILELLENRELMYAGRGERHGCCPCYFNGAYYRAMSDKIEDLTKDITTEVSVIVPVYNLEKYLKQCLDSLLDQSFRNFEVICIDDCSNDLSYRLIESYARRDARIRLYKNPERLGAGESRNRGISLARGEYIFFLDGDDFIEKNSIGDIYCLCKKTNADIALLHYDLYDDQNNGYSAAAQGYEENFIEPETVFSYKDMDHYIFNIWTTALWVKFYKKQFIVNNKIKCQSLHNANDVYFSMISLIKAERMVSSRRLLTHYRYNRPKSITNDLKVNIYLCHFEALASVREELCKTGVYDSVRQSYLNYVVESMLYMIGLLDHSKVLGMVKEIKDKFTSLLGLNEVSLVKIYDLNSLSIYHDLMKEPAIWGHISVKDKDLWWKAYYTANRSKLMRLYTDINHNQYQCAIWGMGFSGMAFFNECKENLWNIPYLIDQDTKKQWTGYEGFPVYSFNRVPAHIQLLITLNHLYYDEIIAEVNKYNKNCCVFELDLFLQRDIYKFKNLRTN